MLRGKSVDFAPMIWLLAAVLAAAPVDSLAPLHPGLAQAGRTLDLVVRPEPAGCRLLLSDAETDAPLVGLHPILHRFGAAGSPDVEVPVTAGTQDGHYLFECAPAGGALVVEVARGDARELFAVTVPPVEVAVAELLSPPKAKVPLLMLLAAAAILLLAGRRLAKVLAVILWLGVAGDAAAHGADEAGPPVPAGSEIKVSQEIQFALELRTATVKVATFLPGASGATAGARTYPAVAPSAVVERDGKKLVFVRLQPELFVGREVTLGWTNGDRVAVISGLNPGDRAVVSGGAFLRNGGASRP